MSEINDAIICQRSIVSDVNSSDRNKRTAENNIRNLKNQTKKLEQLKICIVEPEKKTTRVKVRPSRYSNAHIEFPVSMTQFPEPK